MPLQSIGDHGRSQLSQRREQAADGRSGPLSDESDIDRSRMVAQRSSANAAPQRQEPFFIIGSPRSGTSLLSRMLSGHSRLGVPFETAIVEVFHDMAPVYEPLDNIDNRRRLVSDILSYPTMQKVRPRVAVDQAMAAIEGDGIAGVMDGILSAWIVQQGKSRWGEKRPGNTFYSNVLADWFPQAKLVHIIRDGRDVANSLVTAPFGPKTLFTAAKRWERFVRAGQEIGAGLPSTHYLELRYEDLLDSPEAELRQICDFLDEPFEPAMLEFHEQATQYPTDAVNAHNLNRRVIETNSYKWLHAMTRSELEIVEAAVAPTLQSLDYDTATAARQIDGLEGLFRTHLEPLPRRAVSMARNRRGQIEALARLRLRAKLWRVMLLGS